MARNGSLGGAYSADDNAYYLCFGTVDDNAAANGEIVLTIPFKIADDAKDGDELKVSINYDEALAEKFDITVENMDEDLKALDAGTADATIKVGVTDTSTDESVDVSSSAPVDSSSTPSTSGFWPRCHHRSGRCCCDRRCRDHPQESVSLKTSA